MRKKILIFALSAIIVIAAFAGGCAEGQTEEAVTSVTDDAGLTYTLFSVKGSPQGDYSYVKVTAYSGKEDSGNTIVKVTVPSEVTIDGTVHKVNVVGSLVFYEKNVSEVEISEGVEQIESFAFGYCGATTVTLPSTIKKIGEYAFINCNSLRKINLNATTPPEIGGYVFMFYREDHNVYEVNSILQIKVPKTSYDAYKSAWSEYEKIIVK